MNKCCGRRVCVGGSRDKADYAVIILALYYLITVTELIMGSNEATKYTGQEKQLQQTALTAACVAWKWFPDECMSTSSLPTNARITFWMAVTISGQIYYCRGSASVWWVTMCCHGSGGSPGGRCRQWHSTNCSGGRPVLFVWTWAVHDCTNKLILMRVSRRGRMVRSSDDRA